MKQKLKTLVAALTFHNSMLARYLRNLCEQLVESEKPLILKVSKSNLEIIEPSRGSVGEEMSKKLDLSLR